MVGMNSDSSSGPGPRSPQRRSRLVWVMALSMLASWLLSLAPLPISLVAGLTAVVALVALIPLIVISVTERRFGFALVAVVLGIPATLLVMADSTLSLVFYGPVSELQECLGAALTEQARIQCRADAEGSMASWISSLFGP